MGKPIKSQAETGSSISGVAVEDIGAFSSVVAIKETGTSSSAVAKK